MAYIKGAGAQKDSSNPAVEDVYHSPNVFINHVAVALWDVPQASLAPGQLGFLVDNGTAASDADSTGLIGQGGNTPGGGGIAPRVDGGPFAAGGNTDVAGSNFVPGPPGNCTRADLGKVSEKYESNGNPGAIGNDSTGGWSYGAYQIATRVGTFNNYMSYLQKLYPRLYGILAAAGGNSAATAGTTAFRDKWRTLISDPDFNTSQHNFIQATHHDVLVEKVKLSTGVDICDGTHCNGLQDAAWSISVQHGPGSSIVTKGIIAAKTANPNATDIDFINAIFDERDRVDVYFTSSTPSVKASVARRFVSERADCLASCSV
tara:strand:+ start:815 stop:1768 length:954 start_codon:yes stop_codon:yes gene_type:complete